MKISCLSTVLLSVASFHQNDAFVPKNTVFRQSSILNGHVPNKNLHEFDFLLQESADVVANSGLRRLTVTFAETRFLVSRDESHVYLVQTRVGS